MKNCNVPVCNFRQRGGNRIEAVFEKRMAENFPALTKETYLQTWGIWKKISCKIKEFENLI